MRGDTEITPATGLLPLPGNTRDPFSVPQSEVGIAGDSSERVVLPGLGYLADL